MEPTLPVSRQPLSVLTLRSQAVNVTRGPLCFAPRAHTLCRARFQRQSCSQPLSISRRKHSGHEKCLAAQSEASIDQDSDLVGEDAAFFDVEKQTTKSWTLFTGLLIGVLGLIYVVRLASACRATKQSCACRQRIYSLSVCRHGSTLTQELPTTSSTPSKAFQITLK